MTSWRDRRTFGPTVVQQGDKTTAICTWCVFRIGTSCTYARPSRRIPNPEDTPDWCEMLEGMLRDAKEARLQ